METIMLRNLVVAVGAVFLLDACQQSASTPPPPPSPASYVNALPDAQFVGFAQTVNDFEVQSGQLALRKSSNDLVRGYATRAVAEYTTNAQSLSRNRSSAGVSYAPDENVKAIADNAMSRLNSLQGSDFDKAYADAQVRLQTAAVNQFSAYSGNFNASGPLRRYAQDMLPKSQSFLEYSKRLSGGV
jgi:putative membrane protein